MSFSPIGFMSGAVIGSFISVLLLGGSYKFNILWIIAILGISYIYIALDRSKQFSDNR